MTARRARLQELFAAACDLPREQRSAYLARECGSDRALHQEVSALLAADERANPLDEPVVETHDRLVRGATVLPRLERYRVEREIGRGGMGVVYLAEQLEPIRRPVALKVLRSGLDLQALMGRFESERQVLAGMKHTGIAHIFDAGATVDGRPFFAMELIEGRPITRFADSRRLGLRDRMKLLAEACDAVQHAHDRGVVHCDLKPSNMLVAVQDGQPLVKVIDFGIARAIDGDGEEGFEARAGTPSYMSPERIAAGEVGHSADVYSLGVVLFELVIGGLPDGRPPSVVLADLPPRRARVVACRRRERLARLRRECLRDLDFVVARALASDSAGRYASVADLAADLRRHVAARPVVARPPAVRYSLSRLLARRRGAIAAAAVALVAVGGAAATGALSLSETRRAHDDLLTASRTLIDRVRDSDLASAPGGDPVREQLLADGLRISEQLLDRRPGDRSLRRQVQRGLHTAGILQMEQGRWRDAERALRRALADGAAVGSAPVARAATELDLIRVLRHRREYGEARRRIVELTGHLVVDPDAGWPGRAVVVAAWQEAALQSHLARDGDRALAEAGRALALLENEPEGHRRWYLASRAEAYKLAGTVAAAYTRQEDYSRLFEASVRDSRELIGDDRASKRRHLLALTHDSWAVAHFLRGNPAAALDRAREGLAIVERLVEDHPGRVQYATSWLLLKHKVAEGLALAAERGAAVGELRDGLARGAEFAVRHPEHAPLSRRVAVLQARLEELGGF